MKKILLVTRYLVINGIFAACLYFGFFKGVEGALNVALFMGWFASVLGLVALIILGAAQFAPEEASDKLKESFAKGDSAAIPFALDLTFDLGVAAVFVWAGHYILAVFYISHILAGKGIRDAQKNAKLEKLKTEAVSE